MLKSRFIPTHGIYPQKFIIATSNAGFKQTTRPDILIMASTSSTEHSSAAVFTKNAFAAAPVILSRSIIKNPSSVRSLLVNSGCANACTGEKGLSAAEECSKTVSKLVSKQGSSGTTVVFSTGVIGVHLDTTKFHSSITRISEFGSSHHHWLAAAKAVMTTDTFPKLVSRDCGGYRMAGWSKGAGMIHPNMATMLATILTDAFISQDCLVDAVKYANEKSFNSISVDGDTSTNDSFFVMANGASNTPLINDLNSLEYKTFRDHLTSIAVDLAKLIVRDGEGATKFLDINVTGAKSDSDAKKVASTIAKSPLVKTAMFGQDPNWGRIICAVGYSTAEVDPSRVNLVMTSGDASKSIHLFKNGAPFDTTKELAESILAEEDLCINVDLGIGQGQGRIFTCDLSYDYVKINVDYT